VFTFSKLSLISIDEGGRKFTNFPESKDHLAVPSGTSELFHAFPRATPQANSENITTIILLIRQHFTTFTTGLFSASDSERAVYDRFLFFNTFSLGGWGFGLLGESRSSVSRIMTVRRARIREILCGCIAQFRLPLYASTTQKCFTFVWRRHVPATL